jgi:UDP-glucose 4-epimerase
VIRANQGGHYEMIPFPADREAIDIGDYYGDFSKIKAALGWFPQISLEQGLAETFAYYKKHRAHYWNTDA